MPGLLDQIRAVDVIVREKTRVPALPREEGGEAVLDLRMQGQRRVHQLGGRAQLRRLLIAQLRLLPLRPTFGRSIKPKH
jgi:hypothetical protein